MVASPSITTNGMNIHTASQKQGHFSTTNKNNKQYSPTKSSSTQLYSTSTMNNINSITTTATTSHVNSSSIPTTLSSSPSNIYNTSSSNSHYNSQQQLSCSYPPQTSTNCPSFHNSQSNIYSMRSSPDQCSSPTYHSTTMYHNNQPQSSFQACNNNNTCCTLDACCDNHHHQQAQPFTVSSWQVDETCSSSRIPGKIRSRCDPKCFFHWKNQKLTVDDNLLYPLSTNVSSPPLYHVECKKISKKPHHHSFNHHLHNQHKSSSSSSASCKITFDDSLSYPPHHKSNVNTQSMFEFVPFKLESLPKDYSLSYMTNVPKRKSNFYASQATGHQTSLSELRNRLNEETDLKTQHETTFALPIQSFNNDVITSSLQQKELSPKGTRTRIFSIKELLN